MSTPYSDLDPSRYWRTGVADVHPTEMTNLYKKKFEIGFLDNIATAGSCFAQHVARNLKKNGYNILDTETMTAVPADVAQKFGYGIYSARYGNIYTARQLLQLLKDSQTGEVNASNVWEKRGRFYDAFRPSVEPDGLDSVEEVLAHRRYHLERVRLLFSQMDVFVFTLGLTEAWQRLDDGTIYPTCPGVIAGDYNPDIFGFVNFGFFDIYNDMVEVRKLLMEINPNLKFLLTVSPVPLTATAAESHVLVSTVRSKSILRAVCATLADEFQNVDYFPSYEIVTSPASRGMFYESNLRSIASFGVDTVMQTFFAEHPPKSAVAADDEVSDEAKKAAQLERRRGKKKLEANKKDDVVCEEALLEAFS